MSKTDAQIYNENAVSWIKAAGNEGFEIHSGQKEQPKSESWDAWFHYFDKKLNHENMVRIMKAHENRVWLGKGGVTVPTEWPIDFDRTAAKTVVRYQPPSLENRTPEERAAVIKQAMTNAGFVPKEFRHGKPVSPNMLVGEARQRRQAEIAAEEKKLEELKAQPVPKLSEAALRFMEEENRRRDL